MFNWLKLFISGHSKYSRCWMGLHKWSMPGGWCERCGICDTFFGGHELCGSKCDGWNNDNVEYDSCPNCGGDGHVLDDGTNGGECQDCFGTGIIRNH